MKAETVPREPIAGDRLDDCHAHDVWGVSSSHCTRCDTTTCSLGRALGPGGHPIPTRDIESGAVLCHAQSACSELYVVRTGCFKSQLLMSDGRCQIIGFPMRGDVIGLDGIDADRHLVETIALRASQVCIVTRSIVESKLAGLSTRLMSNKIMETQERLLMLGTKSAGSRVAWFLCDLASRSTTPVARRIHVVMEMSRSELASYLCVAPETVSRVLAHMVHAGMIEIDSPREITLNDRDGLSRLFGAAGAATGEGHS